MGKTIDDHSKTIDDIPLVSPTLPLIIKRYDFPETLSGFIHHSHNENFDLDGPHVNLKKTFKLILNIRDLDWN